MSLTLVPLARPANAGIVDMLEDALARAKAGEFVSAILVAATPTGEAVRMHQVHHQQLVMLAGLHLSTLRLADHALKTAETLPPADDG